MEKNKKEQCRLCLYNRQLVQSHIIPETFYKPLYADTTHHFITASSDETKKISLHQKGYREQLMCKKCDGDIIGRYDKYIAEFIFQHTSPVIDMPRSILVPGINYDQLKLFQLSLLWRFHIAESPAFKAVNLNNNANTIRQMLIDGNPGNETFYPCVIIGPHNVPFDLTGGIFLPVLFGTKDCPMCRIILGGLLWIWFMKPNTTDHPFLECCVKKNGLMHVIKGTPQLTEKIVAELMDINQATNKAPNAHKLGDWGYC